MRFPSASTTPRRTVLFRLLRKRCPKASALLDQLEEEHRLGAHKMRTLEQALTRYQNGGEDDFPGFAAAVDDYADFHWKHMGAEEEEVLPLAKKHLTPEDWDAIDAASSVTPIPSWALRPAPNTARCSPASSISYRRPSASGRQPETGDNG